MQHVYIQDSCTIIEEDVYMEVRMMTDPITRIGLIAGEIWHSIDNKGGESTLCEILESVNYPDKLVLMSLGWLAREGQVFLEERCGDYRVTRKKW